MSFKSKFIMALFVLIIGLYYVLISPFIHKKIALKALRELKKEFGTDISLDSVKISYFGKINLYGVKAKDHKNFEFINIKKIEANLNLNSLINNSKLLDFNSLNLIGPTVKIFTYKKDSVDNFTLFINKFNSKQPKEKAPKPFAFKGNIKIENGKWSIFNYNNEKNKQELLNASNLSGAIDYLKIDGNKIYAELKNLYFNATKNGKKYKLENLSSIFSLQNNYMYFDNLLLKTSNSNLNGYLHFDYKKIKDFRDFANKINLSLYLKKESTFSSTDLNYFVKNLEATNVLTVSGKATGKLNNLTLSNLYLEDTQNKLNAKNIYLSNRTSSSKGYEIKGKAIELQTSFAGLKKILPSKTFNKLPILIKSCGIINYKGDITNNKNLIYANGFLNSGIGSIALDKLTLKNYTSKDKIAYTGNIKTENLNLEKLTGNKSLGLLSTDLQINGVGLNKNATINLKGNIADITLFKKNFKQIELNGELTNQKFIGLITINDDKISGNYNGLFDFSDENLKLQFNSTIENLNLQALGLSKKKGFLSADFQGDFNFSTMDDFLGEISFTNFKFEKDNYTFSNNDIKIISSKSKNFNKKYNITIPDVISGNLEGNFKLVDLPNLIINSSKQLIEKENQLFKNNQSVVLLDLNIQNTFFKLLYPNVDIGQETLFLKGEINELTSKVNLELTINEFKFDNSIFYGSTVLIDNNSAFNPILAKIERADFGKIKANKILLETYKPNSDSLKIKTSFEIGDKKPSIFNLNLFQTKEDNIYKLGFLESDLLIDDKVWKIKTPTNKFENSLEYNTLNKKIILNNFSITRENQSLSLNLNFLNKDDYYINLNLKDLILEDIIPYGSLGNNNFKGTVNGDLDVVKTPKELLPIIKTQIKDLVYNNILLGNLNFDSALDTKNNVFNTNVSLIDENNLPTLTIGGEINNKGEKPIIEADLEFKDKKMDFLNIFLKGVFDDFKGLVSGNLKIHGPLNDIEYNGKLFAKDMAFKVNFLNTQYLFNTTTEINVDNKSLEIVKTKFIDSKEKTTGYASGIINLNDFKNINLDLNFSSNNLLVLDTTIENNESFFGNLYLNGDINIYGLTNELKIDATGDIVNSSSFFINLDKTQVAEESKVVNFIPSIKDFLKTDSIQVNNKIVKNTNQLSLDFILNLKPDAQFSLIFDSKTGDKLTAYGSSEKLNFTKDKNGKLNLTGLYELNNGIYNFRRILNKDFILKKGSTISWTGDIYKAQLDLTATYRKIVTNVGEYLGLESSQPLDTDLIIAIKNQLFNPNIEFDIKTPLAPIQTQNDLETKFADLDEMKRQFGAIIATGKFLTDETPTAQSLTSSAYEVGLKQISEVISSINKNVNVDLEYNQGDILNATSDNFRTAVNLKISNRLNLNTALGINLNNNSIINNVNNNFFGQFEIEYDITKKNNGNFMLKTFSKPTIFGVDNYNSTSINENNNNTTINFAQSYGVGIIFRKSFNKLKEVFLKEN